MTKCQQETRQSLKDPARRDLIAGAAGAVGLAFSADSFVIQPCRKRLLCARLAVDLKPNSWPAAFAATDVAASATPMPLASHILKPGSLRCVPR